MNFSVKRNEKKINDIESNQDELSFLDDIFIFVVYNSYIINAWRATMSNITIAGAINPFKNYEQTEKTRIAKKKPTLVALCTGLIIITSLALGIIGTLAVAGVVSGVVAGGCAIGITVFNLIIAVVIMRERDSSSKAKVLLLACAIIAIVSVAVGAYAITGTVTTKAIGGVMMGVPIPAYILASILGACKVQCNKMSQRARGFNL